MFKPLAEGLAGRTISFTTAYSTRLYVTPELVEALLSVLSPGDWTYLTLQAGALVELVRVDSIDSNFLVVERGVEQTKRLGLPPYTPIYYRPTLSGIRSAIRENIEPISVSTTGSIITETEGLHLYTPNIQGGLDIEVIRNTTIFDGNYQACKPFSCGRYILSSFYLTSKLYPIESVESTAHSFSGLSANLVGEVAEYLGHQAQLVSGNLRDILAKLEIEPEAIFHSSDLVSGNLRDILITIPLDAESITHTGDLVSATLVDKLIEIDYGVEAIGHAAEILSGNLE